MHPPLNKAGAIDGDECTRIERGDKCDSQSIAGSFKRQLYRPWTHIYRRGAENAFTAKRMYGKCKYNANLQSDKKSLVLHKLVWCIFKWGAQVDYRLVFF